MEENNVMKLKENNVKSKNDSKVSSPRFGLIKPKNDEPHLCLSEHNLSYKNREIANVENNSIEIEEISLSSKY
jgi:hypothetical protein